MGDVIGAMAGVTIFIDGCVRSWLSGLQVRHVSSTAITGVGTVRTQAALSVTGCIDEAIACQVRTAPRSTCWCGNPLSDDASSEIIGAMTAVAIFPLALVVPKANAV
jgi:hypothetical protein